ncbi:phosphoribosylaminoimidazole carboxylase [Talaromyces pinophilus]|uniref:Phosphoribosylaminoimidazole carboxylase n=1 Tax=Talaromyces pinophilus TaxID=128442 RepID=A0A6V8HJD2_TALPI|nr:phosphoribosylaminoimidazole carboxylase [Talaromyces pinophilus]
MAWNSPKVGILGGGQLGRMLTESANRLNIEVHVLDAANAPAKQISAHDNHTIGHFNDQESVQELAKTCDVVTAEIEHVNTYALEAVASQVKVEPSWQSIRIIQNKYDQKKHLSKYDIPMADYRELVENTPEELAKVGEYLGYPMMLKSKTLAYDGRGNYPVKSKEDIPDALEALKDRPLYAEKWAHFKMELAVMVVKTKDSVLSYPTVETVQEDSICKLVYAPARNVSDAINKKAQELARNAVAAFDGKGVFGVEMFLLEDDSILLCEIASRVHNSGHYTIEGCEHALSIPNASIHLYSKGGARPGRKMGHITVTGATMYEAETDIQPLIDLVDKIRAERSDIKTSAVKSSVAKPTPTIGVIMGSDSDLKTLVPGLKLLRDYFGIDPEVDITSAHRTPEYMAEYASKAASRGIKVIIAAAGGAAHLPGMAAAHTALPVIGVPVKGSALDGVDSLYSIVQMPRGVPVATVGINNSINAALLAVRILGSYEPALQRKVEEYANNAKSENLDIKGIKIREIGWEKYFAQM